MTQMLTALLFSAAGVASVAVVAAMLRANATAIVRALIGEGAFAAAPIFISTPPAIQVIRRATSRPVMRQVTPAPFHPARLCVAA